MEEEITVTEFVRGLALHDIGKPFALDGWRHARLGYWLLALTDRNAEALIALRHDRDVRNEYFKKRGEAARVPAVTMLAAPLDVLASAVYSLLPTPSRTDCHALQNPFSRLPNSPHLLNRQLLADGGTALREIEEDLWQAITELLPKQWRQTLTLEAKASVEKSLPVDVSPLPGGSDALQRIVEALGSFPERTYPPMNDTTLEQHGRLTGILGYVVYRNLERHRESYVDRFLHKATDARRFPQDKQLVQEHLQACLVRVAWEGLRQWFHQASRVDDLIGTLELASRLRQLFKEGLASVLGVPELATWLVINESQFEIFYLLPHTQEELGALFEEARDRAIERLTNAIIAERLQRDFPQTEHYRTVLNQQLAALACGLRILPVKVPPKQKHGEFAATYGENLLQAYLDSQTYVSAALSSELIEALPTSLPPAETCDVCGLYPVWQPPEHLEEEAKAAWLAKRDYAAHIFRGEREQICVSCAARRAVSFGAIAKRMDAVVHPMFEPGEHPGSWRAVQPESGPLLPPILDAAVNLDAEQSQADSQAVHLADAGAFFVRYRQTTEGSDRSKIDLFPTVSYAADQNGNVTMLTLTPKWDTLFGPYDYGKALDVYGPRLKEIDTGDEENWKRAFAAFYEAHKSDEEGKAATVRTVEPHLARVMERIQLIKRFYSAFEKHLAMDKRSVDKRPIRVLPLDVEFPTLRLLVPADRLDDALRALDRAVTETLFSATYHEEFGERKKTHKLLKLVVPNLLHGTVILFKHKFPLYLALEAERGILRQLKAKRRPSKKTRLPNHSDWYGFCLGLSDLRGTLSEVGPVDAVVTYENLGQVLELVAHVDRPTLLQYAETRQYITGELAQSQALVRASRISRTQVRYVEELEKDALFDAVYFITRAIRR